MFLSRLTLNALNRQVRYDLARPYEMHRSLWNRFPAMRRDDQTQQFLDRVLYRIDTDARGCNPIVLIQSEIAPAWSDLPSGYLIRAAECKELHLAFSPGQRLRFRLRANPTKRLTARTTHCGGGAFENWQSKRGDGKRIGLTTERDQLKWLLRKADAGGFRIPGKWVDTEDPETGAAIQLPNFRVDVVPEGRDRNGKDGHGGVFLAVRFDGLLEVTDPELFKQTVAAGIGSAKGFGFGLLSLAPA